MSRFIEKLKSRDYRSEVIIKLILLFLFLMFSPKLTDALPYGLGHIISKIFKNTTISFMVILLIANWLIDPMILDKLKTGITNKFFIVCFLYWFLHVIGVLYSANSREAGFVVEKKLSLILFPLIFATIHIEEASKLSIYKWFISCVLFFSITCIMYGVYNYTTTGDATMLSLENTLYIDIHRVIFSMYLTLGAYFCFDLHKKKKLHLYILLVYLAVATLHIFLMASRLYMVVYLIFIYFLFYRYIEKKKIFYMVSACCLVVFLVLGTFLYNKNEAFRVQINSMLNSQKGNQAASNGVSEREYQWQAATTLIKRNPIFGIGQGDVVDELRNEYKAMNWQYGYDLKYHAHNQYLQSFIALGIIGLLLLVLVIFYPFIWFNHTNIEAKICSLLFGISLVTDNHTELQQSIVFMFLWLSMFINMKEKSNLKA